MVDAKNDHVLETPNRISGYNTNMASLIDDGNLKKDNEKLKFLILDQGVKFYNFLKQILDKKDLNLIMLLEKMYGLLQSLNKKSVLVEAYLDDPMIIDFKNFILDLFNQYRDPQTTELLKRSLILIIKKLLTVTVRLCSFNVNQIMAHKIIDRMQKIFFESYLLGKATSTTEAGKIDSSEKQKRNCPMCDCKCKL